MLLLHRRHTAIRRFHEEASVRVALVSVTAAALGVDLSAAPSFGAGNFSPTDLRGEYAVGDKAVNYMY